MQRATAAELRLAEHHARAIEGMRSPSPELFRAMRYYRAHPAERPYVTSALPDWHPIGITRGAEPEPPLL